MSLKVVRYINELMASNCYIVVDENSHHCICIDPASEKSLREISFIEEEGLVLDYILLSHEHTDHTWGVNALLAIYPNTKVVCSELCKEALPRESKTYFRFYYDDPEYTYNVERVDYTTEGLGWKLDWHGREIKFLSTPGHSPGSVCIAIDNLLFGGDTIMPFKPFIKKRNGGSKEQLSESLALIERIFRPQTEVYPGHGETTELGEVIKIIKDLS